ncbi:phosphatase PAP2 family protein [Microbacterium memoriense]|uniref:Phosphatase PAP2 family protein n=1 Tax=Microbacterium memoriense TaxID=2978350 RepID=A0ABT2PC61_9MICO|nr:phosphatase PAP2 family protein [Microbacterium memoriense]MCT9002157.1 phosphatase PAP2 family protein [Microbacterium memoriense]
MTEQRPAERITDLEITFRLQWLVIGLALIFATVVLGVLVAFDVELVDLDAWWNSYVAAFAPAFLGMSMALNVIGGGWVAALAIPLGLALVLVIVRRPWSAVYFLAASLASAMLVQIFKVVFGRVRPEDILVLSDQGSFPSGHTANAATMAAVAVVLFPRLWVFLVGTAWVLLMALGRTIVHAHWMTDTIGGTLVGIGAALVIAAVFAARILREREPSAH